MHAKHVNRTQININTRMVFMRTTFQTRRLLR
jgi:hypothetical protein